MDERDADPHVSGGAHTTSVEDGTHAFDGAINISLVDLDDDEALALEGSGPSAEEQHRSYALVHYLRGILPRLTHAADAAGVCLELADHLGPVLGDPQGALDACRTAFRKRPRDLHAARAYRKAALRAGTPKEVSTALDAEAKRTAAASDRGALHVERALLLARHFDNDKAARYAFKHALDAEPGNVIALMAHERALLAEHEDEAAAGVAQKLAAAATDPKLRGEHLARAARHLERAGDEQGGLALAASARLDAPDSPAVLFVLERLCIAQDALSMFTSLRKRQIADGQIDVASAWFDVAIIATYRLDDDALAVHAFEHAKEHAGDELAACLEELAWLHHRRGEHHQASDAIADQLPHANDPRERAALWHRLARVRGEHLEDEDGTIVALEAALTEAPSYYPVLADAGRLFHRTGSRARLLKMHQLEAQAASTPADRGGALRRLGELLIEDELTRDAGIDALREALEQTPGHLSAFVALERALEQKQAYRELVDLYQRELAHAKEPSRRARLHARIGKLATEKLDDAALALTSLREAVQVDVAGGPPPLLLQLAQQLEAAGELEDLVSALTRIAEDTADDSDRASIYERLALVHEKRGRTEDAVLAYKRAVQAAPPSHPAHAAAGRAFLRTERYRDLLEVLEAGLAAAPANKKAMWLQKIAAVQDRCLGRTDDAVKSLQKALEHAPDAFPARQTLLELLTRHRRWSELSAVLAGATEGGPRMSLRRGIIAEAAGDLAAAVEHYGRAVEAGSKLARLPLLRVAAMVKRWDALERHYGTSTDPASLLHERCRAAEIAYERLGRPADSVRYLTEALGASKRALSPVVSMMPLVVGVADTQVRLLDVLEYLTTDVATKLASLRLATHAWSSCDEPERALAAHLRVLALQPADPVSLVAAEIALEERGDRHRLAEVLRAAVADKSLEPQLTAMTTASLGAVLEQLGELDEAAHALEASRAAAGADVSRQTLLALHRVYTALGDTDHVPEVLTALASCPPAGPTQAACHLRLGLWWQERGNVEQAAVALRKSLDADPCHYAAIRALAELPIVSESEVIDALMRAFELEPSQAVVATLGTTLAARLLLLGRWHTARQTVDRVLSVQPDLLPALMLLAETHERRKSWELAADALDRIGDHPQASARIRLEALRRLTTIQVLHLQQREAARGTAERIAALPLADELALRAKLEIDVLLENDESAAKTLAALTDDFTPGSATPVDDLLRLAALQDQRLHDPHRAMETLTRLSVAAGPQLAVPALRVLGDRHEKWAAVRDALEGALDQEPSAPWECAVRRRLAQVLREHLDDAKEALLHEKRILELDPSDGPTAERAALGATSREPADAVAMHRTRIAEAPDAIDSYRALRNLFLAEDDRDAAFCAEAVLVGLGEANEEEEYFYEQRRAQHAGRLTGTLSSLELSLLCPERDDFVVRVLKTIDPLVPRMFPVDMDGYGMDAEAESSPMLDDTAEDTMTLFSLGSSRVVLVSPRLGPCVEVQDEELLLVMPRTLVDAPRLAQQFVCGALLARPTFGGVATDPRRMQAFTNAQLDQLIQAALHVGAGTPAPDDASPVYLDMIQRLNGALGHISRRRLESLAAEAADLKPNPACGEELRAAMNGAAARSAVLCAGDPAVAIETAIAHAGMFAAGATPERRGAGPCIDKLPHNFRCGLAFSVSETHTKLRQRLFEGAGHGS